MIQVIHRAFDILELCARNPEKNLVLTDIADKLKLNHGTCANIIKTLVSRNYTEKVGYNKGYRLGAMSYHLTGNFSTIKDLVQEAKVPMQELAEKLNETCLLAILRKTDLKRIILHQFQSSHNLTVRNITEKDAYDTASGRLMLAYLLDKELESLIDKFGLPGLDVWPEASIKEGLFRELNGIRESGVAFQLNNNHVVVFAVPVLKENSVIACLSVYMPEMRYQGETKNIVLNHLKQAARQINNSLADDSAKF